MKVISDYKKPTMKVVPLFAIPFLVEEYPQSFDDELKYIRSLPINGTHSEDSFVLDKPELKLIRDWIKDRIDFDISNIIGSTNKLFITQSWLTVNKKGESFPLHHHSNSVVSAVWYPYVKEDQSPIIFQSLDNPFGLQLKMKPGGPPIAGGSASFHVRSGNLIIFPSNVYHSVDPNPIDDMRISLSLNTWTNEEVGYREFHSSNTNYLS